MTRMSNVEESDEIEVRIGSIYEKPGVSEETDIFAKSAEEFKDLNGLSTAFKKKMSRSLTKFYRGTGGAESKKLEIPNYIGGYSLFDVILPPFNLDYLAALFEKSTPHAAAVKAKAKNIAGLGYDFVESEKTKLVLDAAAGNDKKLQRIRSRMAEARVKLLEWLQSCNEEDDFVEILLKIWTDYETTGNGYLEIGRTSTGQVGYLGHIPATTMRVRKMRDGFVQIIANRAVFFRNFGDKETPNPIGDDPNPNEVIHFKKYSPTNSYYGVPDIIAALNAVVGNEFAARFNLDYFENKAVPRYVIIVKGGNLSAASQERILEFFQSSLKGKNHRTLYVPLPAEEEGKKVDFKMEPVETGTQDASFTNYRTGNIEEVLMAHGVPLTKAFATSGGDVALAAAQDLDKTFKEQVCAPEQGILQRKLNKVVHEKTDIFDLQLNELSLTSADVQSQIDERHIRTQILVPNEVRAKMGLPGLPHGDEPVAMTAAQQAEQGAQLSGNRTRDQNRTAQATDSKGGGRNAKGDGRSSS